MSDFLNAISHQPENKPFWDGLTNGQFLLRHCKACERAHWYPRAICPHCASADTEWRTASGRGTIYSYSVMRRVAEPYAIAYVTLEEGPAMMTNIVESDLDAIAVGQKVVLAITAHASGQAIACFKVA